MALEIIDIHPHVISRDEVKYPRAPLGGVLSDWARDRPVDPQGLVAAMDAAGVSRAALVHASTCYGYDNSLVVDALREFPDRFAGVFSVDVLAPDAPGQIRKWHGLGLSGLRLFTTGSTMPEQAGWLDDPRSFPAWDCAGELQIPVCVQMHLQAVPQLRTLLQKFTKVSVILDHLGSPKNVEASGYASMRPLLDLAEFPNLYLKATIRNIRMIAEGGGAFQPYFQRVADAFGSPRIAWGSNFPTSDASLTRIVDESRTALSFLPERDQQFIFNGTAAKLYPLLV